MTTPKQPPAKSSEEFPPVTAEEAGCMTLENLRDVAPNLERNLKAGMPYERAIKIAIDEARWAFAHWLFFKALSPDERAIPVADYGDALEVLGNHGGTINQIITEIRAGKFRNWPRRKDGSLIFDDDTEAAT